MNGNFQMSNHFGSLPTHHQNEPFTNTIEISQQLANTGQFAHMRQEFPIEGYLDRHGSLPQPSFGAPQSDGQSTKNNFMHIPNNMAGEGVMMSKPGYMMHGDLQMTFGMQNSYQN